MYGGRAPKGALCSKVCMYVFMYVMSTYLFYTFLISKAYLYPRAAFSAVCVQYLKKVFATIDI